MACDVCLGINSQRCPVCGTTPVRIVCPECDGYGVMNCIAWYSDGRGSELEVEVSPAQYVSLPEHMKGEADECPVCNGRGEVWKEGDELYPVD